MSDIKSFNQISPDKFIINVRLVDRNLKSLNWSWDTRYFLKYNVNHTESHSYNKFAINKSWGQANQKIVLHHEM